MAGILTASDIEGIEGTFITLNIVGYILLSTLLLYLYSYRSKLEKLLRNLRGWLSPPTVVVISYA